jgi:undecaprenyl-diphosphatase
VARRRGPRVALPVLAAVPLGLGAHAAIKYSIRRPRPLTARVTGKHTPSFPSGHAARGAAAAGILGYVAVREGLAPSGVALALGAALAVGGGGSRVYVGRHWATDALGGWGLGVAAAALCALWYDEARARGAGRRGRAHAR